MARPSAARKLHLPRLRTPRWLVPQSLHARLVLSHLAVALISITLISAFAGRSIFNAAREQTGHNAEDLAFAASNAIEKPLSNYLQGQAGREQIEAAANPIFEDAPFLSYTV